MLQRRGDGAVATLLYRIHCWPADVIGDDRAIFAPLGTTSTPLTRYAMLESTMDNLLLAASAASADLPIALSNGWRYGAPIPAGPITGDGRLEHCPSEAAGVCRDVDRVPSYTVCTRRTPRRPSHVMQWKQRGGYVQRCRGLELAVKLENPSGERIQEIRIDGTRLRANASYKVAFLGEQAVPSEYGSDRQHTGVSAVDALRQYVTSRDVVASDIVGSVTLV